MAKLQSWIGSGTGGLQAFSGTGHGRFKTQDGELEGRLELRVDPPGRVWMQLETGALFGLVRNRVVISLPGDGFVLFWQTRNDDLVRIPFEESMATELHWGGLDVLMGLAAGRVVLDPLGAHEAEGLQVGSLGREGDFEYHMRPWPEDTTEKLVLRVEGGLLRVLEWRHADTLRLRVRYQDYVPLGPTRHPTRLRVEAPSVGFEADVRLDQVLPRAHFRPEDFEVGGNSSRSPGVGTG